MFEEADFDSLVVAAVDYLVEQTADAARVKEWGEVNELKYLFRPSQPWKLDQVHQFLKDAKEFLENL